MESIEILKTGAYLPKTKITSDEIEEKLKLEKGYIYKRTGIQTRYYAKESIEEIAIKAVQNLVEKIEDEKIINEIGLIIVATTSPKNIMPGISNEIQKRLKINKCISLDILAGCSGYINALDIAQIYLATGKVKKALVIGVDKLK